MRDEELHAYVDGQLASLRCVEAERELAENAEHRERVAAYRSQNEALHRLFDPLLNQPLDDRFAGLHRQLADQLEGKGARR